MLVGLDGQGEQQGRHGRPDQPVTGARLAEAAGVSASYGRALLSEFQADPTLAAGQGNGQRPGPEVGER